MPGFFPVPRSSYIKSLGFCQLGRGLLAGDLHDAVVDGDDLLGDGRGSIQVETSVQGFHRRISKSSAYMCLWCR